MRISQTMLHLATVMDPDAFKPHPDWRERIESASTKARDLVSSNNPGDHMLAAMLATISPRPR